jgi:hypothetical protein
MWISRVIPTRPKPTFAKLCRIGVEVFVSQRPEGPAGIVQKINDSCLHMESPIDTLVAIDILTPRRFVIQYISISHLGLVDQGEHGCGCRYRCMSVDVVSVGGGFCAHWGIVKVGTFVWSSVRGGAWLVVGVDG